MHFSRTHSVFDPGRSLGARQLMTGLLVGLMLTAGSLSNAQVLEEDPALKPKPPQRNPASGRAPISQQEASGIGNSGRFVLKGNVTTLDSAMVQEKNIVDWYGWYMSCRQYLVNTGGLQCAVGTMIRFNRNGSMIAQTAEPGCLLSVSSKMFPLPRNTKLDAILLPVRSARSAPASPDELYRYLKGGD